MRLLRSQAGLTLAETLVAATLLLIGALATFALVDTANSTTSRARAREGATNLAREVLEDARSISYAQVGPPGWLNSKLQALAGGSGTVTSPSTYTQRTTVNRRGFTYTVSVTPCSVDDSRDGFGAHGAGINWCGDSGTAGTADGQAEDMKRVAAAITWTVNGRSDSLTLTATFGSSGAAIGPATSTLAIVAPTGLTGSPPVVTTNPSGGIVKFRGTSAGAADMRFTVNGAEQPTGVVNNNNGTWDFSWNITALKDGTYTIGAVAIDALGTRGQPLTMQITLNRGSPAPLANLTGGYNYVKIAGTKTTVVELAWDANPEGNVTGYEVDRGATLVCGGPTSLDTWCFDTSPPTSGSTVYTVKTWYLDGAKNQQFISTTYSVTAPGGGSVATLYGWVNGNANPTGSCYLVGTRKDLSASFPTSGGTDSTLTTTGGNWMVGCMAAFTATTTLSAGTGTIQAWYTNSGKQSCSADWGLILNGTSLVVGTSIFNGGTASRYSIAPASTPTKVTLNFTTPARTFSAGDVLSLALQGDTSSGACSNHTLFYGSGAHQSTLSLPLASSGVALAQPTAPTGLTLVHNADGTNTLTWNAATGTPAPDFYRVYRDGQNYTNRVDTVGDGGTATLSWTDTNTGGTTHTYYVTTAAATLTESNMAGPVSG